MGGWWWWSSTGVAINCITCILGATKVVVAARVCVWGVNDLHVRYFTWRQLSLCQPMMVVSLAHKILGFIFFHEPIWNRNHFARGIEPEAAAFNYGSDFPSLSLPSLPSHTPITSTLFFRRESNPIGVFTYQLDVLPTRPKELFCRQQISHCESKAKLNTLVIFAESLVAPISKQHTIGNENLERDLTHNHKRWIEFIFFHEYHVELPTILPGIEPDTPLWNYRQG